MGYSTVSKLKGDTENDELQYYGKIVVGFVGSTGGNLDLINLKYPSGDIMDYVSATEGLTLTKNRNTLVKVTGSDGGKVYVSNKYALQEFGIYHQGFINFDEVIGCENLTNLMLGYNPVTSQYEIKNFSFKKITDNLPNVTVITAYKTPLVGNLDELYLEGLTDLSAEGSTSFTGTIDKLGKMPLLSTLKLSGYGIVGDLEGFVANRVAKCSQNSGSVNMDIFDTVGVKFNNVSTAGSSTLSWSASGDNIVVTWRNNTTTIHVNSDGTWTRVS